VAGPWTREGSDGRSETYPDQSIHACYNVISKACLSAGLAPADAEDLAQDLWEWLIRTRVPMAVIATPWLSAAVHNYVLRFRRRSHRHGLREGYPLAAAPEPRAWQPEEARESNELLDRVAQVLPNRERNLLACIRRGYSLAEASKLLGIPPGSRTYYQNRLVTYARRELTRRALTTQKGTNGRFGLQSGDQRHEAGAADIRRHSHLRSTFSKV
jgi:DNA-directed RNA polymerase specialized sigma24 family protein